MRSILVPVASHAVMPSVLACAVLLARRFEALIEGFPLTIPVAEYVPVDMVGGITWIHDEQAEQEGIAEARSAFERFMRGERIPSRAEAPDGTAFVWNAGAPAGEGFLGSHARLFDVTVVGRPTRGQGSPSLAALEVALFESGRPILIAPPVPPREIGRTVVVSWNGSTETARAVALAMPLLARAERVHVLGVEGGMVPGPSVAEMGEALRRHGLLVTESTAEPGRRSTGEAILEEAQRLGCDLLIKGAYTQSRLRQMIFGGATNHLLAEAEIPVLMAH